MDRHPPPPPSSSSPAIKMNSSILIIGIILTIVLLLSAAIHLLLRYLDRRLPVLRLPSSSSSSDTAQRNQAFSSRRVLPEEAQPPADRLPAFTFSSVFSGSGKDCAVCLSQFEANDQLRLLPACAHAFHAACIDVWLATNLTCPLCRASIRLTAGDDVLDSSGRSGSFRVEIGSVSRRGDSSADSFRRRSYSFGSFDYVLDDDDLELPPPPAPPPPASVLIRVESVKELVPEPPGDEVAEAAGGRGWLREYVDRVASSASASSLSSRTLSFRRFAGLGSGRRSSGSWDLEGNMEGQDGNISNFFRWLAGY